MAPLTAEQWHAWKGDFYWMRVRYKFQPVHAAIIQKWMARHCEGWWYYEDEGASGSTLVIFQHQSEMVSFRIWIADNPFERDHGDVP
jgi:hypothetical protein